jgi:hypothetical protein
MPAARFQVAPPSAELYTPGPAAPATATVMSIPLGSLNMTAWMPPMLSLSAPMPWPTGDHAPPPGWAENRPALVAA